MPNILNLPAMSRESRQIAVMVGWIALIHFVVEAFIMGTLAGWQLTRDVISEGLLDCALLTIFSSPLIYYFVSKPFIDAANAAEDRLTRGLSLRTEQAKILESARIKLQTSLEQNEELRDQLQQSNDTVAEINELTLQRIGADLHDGPAQLLTYSLLRLNKLAPIVQNNGNDKSRDELEGIQSALSDTLNELRNISRGLSMPELDAASLENVINLAVTLHQELTGTTVATAIEPLRPDVPHAIKICVYRLVQESLSNAYKHGGAVDQKVVAYMDKQLVLVVSDKGPGFAEFTANKQGLGLIGMRARVEALGGKLSIDSARGMGTVMTARLDLEQAGSRRPQDA